MFSQFKLLILSCLNLSPNIVLVALLLASRCTVAHLELRVEDLLREACNRHLYDVACPLQLVLCDSAGDAVYVCIIPDADVCLPLFPADTSASGP